MNEEKKVLRKGLTTGVHTCFAFWSVLDAFIVTKEFSFGKINKIDNDDLELHNQILPILRAIKKEIQNRNEVISTQPVTSQNIDEKIEDLKITNFYEIVSSKSSFQEAYDFVKNNYTKKELLLIDNSIPDYEGYNWTKEEGIKHLIWLIEFNKAS